VPQRWFEENDVTRTQNIKIRNNSDTLTNDLVRMTPAFSVK
jgi:hypothetical protein